MSRLRLVGMVVIVAIGLLGLAPGGVCLMSSGCHMIQGGHHLDCCTPSNVPDGWNKVPCRPQQVDTVYLQPEKSSPRTVQVAITTPVVMPPLESVSRSEISATIPLVSAPRFLLACNFRL